MSSRLLSVICLFSATVFVDHAALAGVHVGDPIPAFITLDDGVTISDYYLPVSTVVTTPCGGGSATTTTLNTTLRPNVGLDLPNGDWCAVVLNTSGNVIIEGTEPGSASLDIELDVGAITLNLSGGILIGAGSPEAAAAITFLAVDWFEDLVAPHVTEGYPVDIDPQSGMHADLADSLEDDSRLNINW